MKELTENQKTFLLNNFFKNEQYAGWKNIATTLIEKGKCVVAGDRCIWLGGIGNFINTSNADGYFDCLLYEFNLDYFMTSEYYKEIHAAILEELSDKIIHLQEIHSDISNLK